MLSLSQYLGVVENNNDQLEDYLCHLHLEYSSLREEKDQNDNCFREELQKYLWTIFAFKYLQDLQVSVDKFLHLDFRCQLLVYLYQQDVHYKHVNCPF